MAAYAFSPQPAGSGPAASTLFVASDLMPSGQQLVASFVMGSPGTVSLHAFPAGAGSYDTSTMRACLEFAGQAPCGPAPFPNPAYWTVSANDLAHHSGYQLRVAAPASGGPLLGIDLGWNGSHHLALSGLNLPGTCSAASAGYTAGCGVRFKFSAAGTATISAGPGLLHLKVRDKAGPSATSTACNVKFSGSTPCALDHAALWTGDLYPEAGGRISPVSMTVDWP